MAGSTPALSTVFSLLVCETQMLWSMSHRLQTRTLLRWIDAASAKPSREWSVKQVGIPIVLACMRHSWPITEDAWCPCTMPIRSRSMI